MDVSYFIEKEKVLIGLNKIYQVIQDLKTVLRRDDEMYNLILLISSDYHHLERERIKGVLTKSEDIRFAGQIVERLIALIDRLVYFNIPYSLPHLNQIESSLEILNNETILWDYVDSTGLADGYEFYCSCFPNGFYVDKVKSLLQKPGRKSGQDAFWVSVHFRKDNVTSYFLQYTMPKFNDVDSFFKEIQALLLSPSGVHGYYGRDWYLRNVLNRKSYALQDDIAHIFRGTEMELVMADKYRILSNGRVVNKDQIDNEIEIRNKFIENYETSKLKAEAEKEIFDLKRIGEQLSEARINKNEINYQINYLYLFTKDAFFIQLQFILSILIALYVGFSNKFRYQSTVESSIVSIFLFLATPFMITLYYQIINNRFWKTKNKYFYYFNVFSIIVSISFVVAETYVELPAENLLLSSYSALLLVAPAGQMCYFITFSALSSIYYYVIRKKAQNA